MDPELTKGFFGDERDGIGPATPRPNGRPVFTEPNCVICGAELQRNRSGFQDQFECPTEDCRLDDEGRTMVIMDWPAGPVEMPNEDEFTFEPSSGNVFADLGFENADELLVRADLCITIVSAIRKNSWTRAEAAKRTALTEPEIAGIMRMKTEGFSQERLQDVLTRLPTVID